MLCSSRIPWFIFFGSIVLYNIRITGISLSIYPSGIRIYDTHAILTLDGTGIIHIYHGIPKPESQPGTVCELIQMAFVNFEVKGIS